MPDSDSDDEEYIPPEDMKGVEFDAFVADCDALLAKLSDEQKQQMQELHTRVETLIEKDRQDDMKKKAKKNKKNSKNANDDEGKEENADDWKRHVEGFFSQDQLRKYMSSRAWNMDKAVAFMHSTYKWRIKQRVRDISCPMCVKNPNSHSFRQVGFDNRGRPFVYANFNEARDRWDAVGNRAHMVNLLEAMLPTLRAKNVSNWVWFIDFQGYGFWDNKPSIGLKALKAVNKYPGVLGAAIMYNAPWLFQKCWSLFRSYVDEVTQRKVRFINTMEELRAVVADETMALTVDAEMLDWLAKECAENRADLPAERKKRKQWKKHWEYYQVEGREDELNALLEAKDTEALAAFVTNNRKAHDPRGTKSYLAQTEFVVDHPCLPEMHLSKRIDAYLSQQHGN